jgi:MATE family multidrug resistance protein
MKQGTSEINDTPKKNTESLPEVELENPRPSNSLIPLSLSEPSSQQIISEHTYLINLPNTSLLGLLKRLAIISPPLIASGLATTASSAINSILISQRGPNALAAGALIQVNQWTAFGLASSIQLAMTLQMSPEFGGNRIKKVGEIFRPGIILGAIISVPIMLYLAVLGPILQASNQDKDVVALVESYFGGYLAGVPATVFLASNNQVYNSIQRTHLGFAQQLCEAIILSAIAFSTIMPDESAKSAMTKIGIANAIAKYITLAISSLFLAKYKKFAQYELFTKHGWFDFHQIKNLLLLGAPFALQVGIYLLSVQFLTFMVSQLGTNALSAQYVSQQLALIINTSPILSISLGGTLITGSILGTRNFPALTTIRNASLLMAGCWSSFWFLISLFAGRNLVSIFLDVNNPANNALANLTETTFKILMASEVADSAMRVVEGSLRGIKNTKVPMMVNIASMWSITVPLAALFSYVFELGVPGIAASLGFGYLGGALVENSYFNYETQEIAKQTAEENYSQTFMSYIKGTCANTWSYVSSCGLFGRSNIADNIIPEVAVVRDEEITLRNI